MSNIICSSCGVFLGFMKIHSAGVISSHRFRIIDGRAYCKKCIERNPELLAKLI